MTKAPHWNHQKVCGRIFAVLDTWLQTTSLGQAAINPGIIFTDTDNVILDLVWASNQRLAVLLDNAGLTAAPELVVEVLSYGGENKRRDKVALKLYSTRGVHAYWIIDWQSSANRS